MAIRINIRKILSTLLWGCTSAGVLVLLVAAIRYRNTNACKGYVISLTGTSISKKEILSLLTPPGTPKIQDRPVQSFDLRRLEITLERNIWVRKSRLFFDNNNVLHIDITERTPVTRIFTEDGNSFYLDSTGIRLPLQTRLPVKLPVFTGYPRRGPDSVVDAGIRQISAFLRQDPSWMEQIAQINIVNRKFELEPETGNYRIVLGDGSDVAAKFHRLLLFDQQVLSKVGLDRYEQVDISYAGQVVATRKGSELRRYDSLQGLNNIRQLIRSAQQLQPDTLRQQTVRPLETNNAGEQNLSSRDLLPGNADSLPNRKPKP